MQKVEPGGGRTAPVQKHKVRMQPGQKKALVQERKEMQLAPQTHLGCSQPFQQVLRILSVNHGRATVVSKRNVVEEDN